MSKDKLSPEASYKLKESKLEGIIERLKAEIPLEGKKWQQNMIRHYTDQLEQLREAYNDIRRPS